MVNSTILVNKISTSSLRNPLPRLSAALADTHAMIVKRENATGLDSRVVTLSLIIAASGLKDVMFTGYDDA
jgi:hypothetical protein